MRCWTHSLAPARGRVPKTASERPTSRPPPRARPRRARNRPTAEVTRRDRDYARTEPPAGGEHRFARWDATCSRPSSRTEANGYSRSGSPRGGISQTSQDSLGPAGRRRCSSGRARASHSPGPALASIVTATHTGARARVDTCPRHAEGEKIANRKRRAGPRAGPDASAGESAVRRRANVS